MQSVDVPRNPCSLATSPQLWWVSSLTFWQSLWQRVLLPVPGVPVTRMLGWVLFSLFFLGSLLFLESAFEAFLAFLAVGGDEVGDDMIGADYSADLNQGESNVLQVFRQMTFVVTLMF